MFWGEVSQLEDEPQSFIAVRRDRAKQKKKNKSKSEMKPLLLFYSVREKKSMATMIIIDSQAG